MSALTNFLKLIKPGKGEYQNTWNEPVNGNSDKLDAFLAALNTEIVDARFSKDTLKDFLEVAHESDGALKATPEVVKARNSTVYGHKNASGDDWLVGEKLNTVDLEILGAREASASLRDSLAFRHFGIPNMVISGTKNGNGYPTWLSFTANKAEVNGQILPLYLLIEGKVCRIRTKKEITISGAAGTYYLYADFQSDGVVTVDGDSTTPPPSVPTGTTSNDTNVQPRIFSDVTKDFTVLDVAPGDAIDILSGLDAGRTFVKQIAPGGDTSKLLIVGLFPKGGTASNNYFIRDTLAVTVGFSATEVAASGRIFVGEADFDGVAVTAVRPRHFKDTFVGEWRAFDVSVSATQQEIWTHQLGSSILDVSVQVSQANDDSQPVEELSLADVKNTLAFTPGNGTLAASNGTLATQSVTLSSGDQSVTQQPSLTGSVALTGTAGGSLGGDVKPSRSAAAKWTKNLITIKNVVPNLFYKDYSGTERQTGYLRVIVRKRG